MIILNTVLLVSMAQRLAVQSDQTAAMIPHATLPTTSAQAHQPLLLAQLKQPELVALEAAQVPAPINALPHMEENAVPTMLNAALALAFLSLPQQQALLSPNLHPGVLRIKLRARLHWAEDAATMDLLVQF